MHVAALLLVLLAGATARGQDSTAEYLAGFDAALVALDAGANDTAERCFEALAPLAPRAPVWRVCAGVAAARAGRAEDARAHFEAGLAHGYPASDLAALHPLGAEVAAGLSDVLVAGTEPVSPHGLREVPADSRYMRDRVVNGEPLGPFTHVLGRFCYEGGRRSPFICAHVSAYLVDWDAGTLRDVSGVVPNTGRSTSLAIPATRGLNDPATVLPRPRGPAFLRLLRSGLHVDDTLRVHGPVLEGFVAEDGAGGRRRLHLSTDGVRWERRHFELDLDLLAATPLPPMAAPATTTPFEKPLSLPEAQRVLRAREWFAPEHRARIHVRALTRPGEASPWVLVAHVQGELPHTNDGAVTPPLRVLSPEGDVELAVVAVEGRDWGGWQPASLRLMPPIVVPEHDRLVLAAEDDRTIVAFDTTSWAVAWRHGSGPSAIRRIEASGELLHASVADAGECEVYEVRTGAVRFYGAPIGLERTLGDAGDERFFGAGHDALYVFASGALRPEPEGVEPAVALWFVGEDLVAVASDGSWALPTRLLNTDSRVLVGDTLRATAPLAPWLLDPLHVRTAHLDLDPAPRRVPAPR